MGRNIYLIIFCLTFISCSIEVQAVNFPKGKCLITVEVAKKVAAEILQGQTAKMDLTKWTISSKEDETRFEITFKYNCPTGRKCVGGLSKVHLSKADCSVLYYNAEK